VICTDENLCTRDLCCSDNGCYYAPICCDDNNACTIDSCDPYVGCQNVKISCDDGDECTIDRCNCEKGCEHFPVDVRDNSACADWTAPQCSTDADCADTNECTENSCQQGSCHVTALDCDDNDSCTIDSCHPDTGCNSVRIPGCDTPINNNNSVEDLTTESTTTQELSLPKATVNDKGLSAGPIAGIVTGVVALIAVIGFIGYKISRNSSPDNAYKAM